MVHLTIGELKQSYEWLIAISRKSSWQSELLVHDEENKQPTNSISTA